MTLNVEQLEQAIQREFSEQQETFARSAKEVRVLL